MINEYSDLEEESDLWATTKYGPIKIKIFTCPRKEIQADAITHWQHGVMTIFIAESVMTRPILLDKVLIHEFMHVIEYMNDPGYLDPTIVDCCTALAQTVEVGMHQLLRNLKQVNPKPQQVQKKTSRKRQRNS